MKCKDFRENILDLATMNEAAPEAKTHAVECAGCAAELESFRKTMAMMDEWVAPEDTSPYFMTRLRARIREQEEAAPARGWLTWFHRPVLALAMTLLIVLAISLFRGGLNLHDASQPPANTAAVKAKPGTAVGDLQQLDKDHELLADFDMLDSLDESPAAQVQQ